MNTRTESIIFWSLLAVPAILSIYAILVSLHIIPAPVRDAVYHFLFS